MVFHFFSLPGRCFVSRSAGCSHGLKKPLPQNFTRFLCKLFDSTLLHGRLTVWNVITEAGGVGTEVEGDGDGLGVEVDVDGVGVEVELATVVSAVGVTDDTELEMGDADAVEASIVP